MISSRQRAAAILNTDLYCMTAEAHSRGRSNMDVVREMLDAGIRLIQYREKEKEMGEKYAQCKVIRQMTRDAGAAFIVNDHADLALMVQADGIHIGQEDLPIEAVRALVGERMVIGLSTHSPEQARNAIDRGADYIGVGPIYRTHTKKDVCEPVGLTYIDYVVANHDIPFVAIGGIKAHNVADVIDHGASCVCMVTEIVGADDLHAKINDIRATMTQKTRKQP